MCSAHRRLPINLSHTRLPLTCRQVRLQARRGAADRAVLAARNVTVFCCRGTPPINAAQCPHDLGASGTAVHWTDRRRRRRVTVRRGISDTEILRRCGSRHEFPLDNQKRFRADTFIERPLKPVPLCITNTVVVPSLALGEQKSIGAPAEQIETALLRQPPDQGGVFQR